MKVEIDMADKASKHLEFAVRERANGRYDVVEYLTSGDTITYANFPDRSEAEKFVLAQPDCWE